MCDHTYAAAKAFGFRCPACGDGSRLDIQAQVWVTLTEDGSDPDAAHDVSHHCNEASYFFCTRCAASGWVAELRNGGAS